ncbi:hypothetical protein [Pseudodesulfovibrio karagichevae]|uniref:Uncharacterized protein n=1 Tax=Pseudodesulfovibrio karagichevae TaxID=3239305 RepID=A0ABV4K911_9BACT
MNPNLKMWKTPHDHGVKALSHFGIVRLTNDRRENLRFMCLCCGEVWSVPAGKRLEDKYWLCRGGCNAVFWGMGAYLNGITSAIWKIYDYCASFENRDTLTDDLIALTQIVEGEEPFRKTLPGINGPVEVSWEDSLEGILDYIDNHAMHRPGSKLALNTVRHIVARIWDCLEKAETSIPHGAKAKLIPAFMADLAQIVEPTTPSDVEQVVKMFPLPYGLYSAEEEVAYLRQLAEAGLELLKLPPRMLGTFGEQHPNLDAAIEAIHSAYCDKLTKDEQELVEETIYRLSTGNSSYQVFNRTPPAFLAGELPKADENEQVATVEKPWPSAKEVGQGVMKYPDGSERSATLYEVPLGEILNFAR